mgnify:CR=1 FL=1
MGKKRKRQRPAGETFTLVDQGEDLLEGLVLRRDAPFEPRDLPCHGRGRGDGAGAAQLRGADGGAAERDQRRERVGQIVVRRVVVQ